MVLQKGVDGNYWTRRSDMMYYKYIDILIKAFAFDAKTIIDVGSANTRYIEKFHWIPEKFTLDVKKPYKSSEVTAIETDFLTYTPEEKYDFATCFQVLEHIPEVEAFARKLFEVSDRVLISVPYLWPKGAEEEHVNDPVDQDKLNEWFGREPSYSIIVAEPLRIPSKGISQRLICYYGPEDKVDYREAQENVRKLQVGSEVELERILNKIERNVEMYNDVQNDLKNIILNQEKYYQLTRMELETFNLKSNLEKKMSINQEMEQSIELLEKEKNNYQSRIQAEVKGKKYYLKEYDKILQSTSWKLMKPTRMVGSFLKKLIRKKRV